MGVLALISIRLGTLLAAIGQCSSRQALALLTQMADVARVMPWTDDDASFPKLGTRDDLEHFARSFNGLLVRLQEALERSK